MVKQVKRLALIVAVVFVVMGVWQAPMLVAENTKADTFTFVQLCDPQLGFGGYEHDVASFKQAVKRINALKPDFVVICGDLVNTPDDKSFSDFNRIKDGFTIPCYCVPGNHDIGGKPSAASLARYREVVGKDRYSFTHKEYTFVITNTQLWKASLNGESQKHDAWVTQTLQAAKKKNSPVFIASHHPLFLKTFDEKDEYFNLPLAKRQEILNLYKQSGVVAVLGGHTHRTIINDYQGIQLVNGEATSRHFDKRPLGFRLWHVASPVSITHEFVPLEKQSTL